MTQTVAAVAQGPDPPGPTASPQAAHGRTRPAPAIVGAYSGAFLLAAALVTLYFRAWTVPSFDAFPEGWDLTWMQTMFAVHGKVGPFGVTEHLAYPYGFSPWGYPQLGLIASVFAWISVGILNIPSSLAVWLFIALSAGLNAMALLFFFRSLIARGFGALVVVLAAVTGGSSFVLSTPNHANLIPFFILPLMLGILVRWPSLDRGPRWAALSGLGIASMSSPLWWVTVALVMVPFMAIPDLVRRRWAGVGRLIAVEAALLLGFAVQTAFYLVARPASFVDDRDAWQSNLFGGHLSDLFVSSPWLTEQLAALQRVRDGSSIELMTVGLVGGMAATTSVVLVIVRPPRRWGNTDTTVMSSATVVSCLLFLLGGLGNLQAAFAVLAGTVSPARVWSRLLVLLAILGLGWLLLLLQHWSAGLRTDGRRRTIVSTVLVVACLGTWYLDARSTPRSGPTGTSLPVAFQELPEYAPVGYIVSRTAPCPVAQLPQNGMPSARVYRPDSVYRGLLPYLVAPDWFWSIGSWSPSDRTLLTALPTTLESRGLRQLEQDGYCAVLFDKSLSQTAAEQNLPLEGRTLGSLPRPDFQTDRYNVYLLDSDS